MTFAVTASGADLVINEFSFYGSRTSSAPERSWNQWDLSVDTGSGFTSLFTSLAGTIATDETWSQETAGSFSV